MERSREVGCKGFHPGVPNYGPLRPCHVPCCSAQMPSGRFGVTEGAGNEAATPGLGLEMPDFNFHQQN